MLELIAIVVVLSILFRGPRHHFGYRPFMGWMGWHHGPMGGPHGPMGGPHGPMGGPHGPHGGF